MLKSDLWKSNPTIKFRELGHHNNVKLSLCKDEEHTLVGK